MTKKSLLALIAVGLLGAALRGRELRADREQEIYFISQDESGREQVESDTPRVFQRRLTEALSPLHDSTLEALQARDHAQGAPSSWSLRTVVVGLSVTAEAGLGSVLKISATPRFRLAFSNAKDPVLP